MNHNTKRGGEEPPAFTAWFESNKISAGARTRADFLACWQAALAEPAERPGDAELLPEDMLRQQAFVILSRLQSGTENVVRLDAALAAVATERKRWRTALGACDAALAQCQPCADPECGATQREYIETARASAAQLLRA